LHSPKARLRNLAGFDKDKLGSSFNVIKEIAEMIPGRVRRVKFYD